MTPGDYATLRRIVKRDEGLRLLPYTDVANRLSIGYGRNLTDCGISQTEANDLLENDLTRAVSDLQQAFPFVLTLDGVRQVVLAFMAFNLGIPRLAKFEKMWKAIRAEDYGKAAIEMLESHWASQVGARAIRLATAMERGTFADAD
jgi:lysozyme